MAARAPMSGETLRAAGAQLWERNKGRLWANIDPTERVLMAYAKPGPCWAARDDLLQPCAVSGWHHARSAARLT